MTDEKKKRDDKKKELDPETEGIGTEPPPLDDKDS